MSKNLYQDVKFDIKKTLGIVEKYPNGWALELSVVSWNGKDPIFDLRMWNADHSKMNKGATFTTEEILNLKAALGKIFRPNEKSADAFGVLIASADGAITIGNNEYFKVSILKDIADLSRVNDRGFTKKLTVTAWATEVPKFDIRLWSANYAHMSLGITLHPNEATSLAKILKKIKDKDLETYLQKASESM